VDFKHLVFKVKTGRQQNVFSKGSSRWICSTTVIAVESLVSAEELSLFSERVIIKMISCRSYFGILFLITVLTIKK